MAPTIVPKSPTHPQPLDTPLAAIYARVSTTDQADRGFSLPTQIEACCSWVQEHNYRVPESYIFSEDYTGMSLHRPALTQIRELAQQGVIQAIIVYDQDRLSRKLAHQFLLNEEFEKTGVSVYVLSMPMTGNTPEAQLFSNMRGVFAEYERTKILERTKRGQDGRAKAGFPPGGAVPLGYVYVKHEERGAHYEIEPEEAALVRRIFHLYVERGLSMSAIARQLTAEGVPSQSDRRARGPSRALRSGTWHGATIRFILTNETYIGTLH